MNTNAPGAPFAMEKRDRPFLVEKKEAKNIYFSDARTIRPYVIETPTKHLNPRLSLTRPVIFSQPSRPKETFFSANVLSPTKPPVENPVQNVPEMGPNRNHSSLYSLPYISYCADFPIIPYVFTPPPSEVPKPVSSSENRWHQNPSQNFHLLQQQQNQGKEALFDWTTIFTWMNHWRIFSLLYR